MMRYRTFRAWRASGADASVAAIVAAIAVGAFPAGAVFGQCQYEVTAIIEGPPCPPFGDSPPLIGSGLNNLGHVVGRFAACPGCGTSCFDSAFFWSEDTGLIPLPMPDEVLGSRAYDINDHGRIVGEAAVSGKGWRGFMYDINTGEFQFLQPLHDGAVAVPTSIANAINNNGIVAGARIIGKPGQSPMPSNAVIWDTNTGEVVDLGVMNGPNSAAFDVSETEEATGMAGNTPTQIGWAIFDNVLHLLDNPEGSIGGGALSINIHSRLGGGANFFVKGSPFALASATYWHDDSWTVINMLPICQSSSALALNDAGQLVGLCLLSTGAEQAFL